MKLSIFAIILIVIGISITAFQVNKVKESDLIPGVVIDIIDLSSDDGVTYRPLISYSDINDQKQNFEPYFSSNPCPYKIGDEVSLLYDRESGVVKGLMAVNNIFYIPYLILSIGVLILGYRILLIFDEKIFNFIRRQKLQKGL